MSIGDDLRRRAICGVVLLLLLVFLAVAAGVNDGKCPSQQCVVDDYETHVGSEVRFWGTVTQSDPLTVRTHTEPSVQLRLRGVRTSVPEGARFVFYGTVEPNHVIDVSDFVVHGSTNRRVAIAVSTLAYPLAGLLWFREWKFDWRRLTFERREEGR